MRRAAWLAAALLLTAAGVAAAASAQLLGTVHDTRSAWNPFAAANDMKAARLGSFVRELELRVDGGRNRDGIYAMRFVVDRELRQTFKRGAKAGSLVSGQPAAFANNIVFRVPASGIYRVRFDPVSARYAITPPVIEQQTIESLQINGFVHDREGLVETFDGRRTHPAEIWDASVAAHELKRNDDGSWTIDLPLSTRGGHQQNGVYQALLSANHNADWGYSAIVGQPGRLAGGNGYTSRVGHVEESAIVFRVTRDATYRFTVWPEQYRYAIDPPVEYFPGTSFQVNGDVVAEPWNPASPEHAMTPSADGTWTKDLVLRRDGGNAGNGLYTMNFSIDGNWALDSIGFGGEWGKTWHAAPQEWNLLFRVPADGTYRVTLDPARGRFAVEPPVEPVTRVESLQLCGDFESFGDDGQGGWNPQDASHDMQAGEHGIFFKDIRLTGGRSYRYKFSANRSAWGWSLADYPYDGERRLAPHGNADPLRFDSPRDGVYRFTADTLTGDYSVVPMSLSEDQR